MTIYIYYADNIIAHGRDYAAWEEENLFLAWREIHTRGNY